MKNLALLGTSLLFAALFAAPVFAQFETSEVLGTVYDPSRNPAPKASVTLTNQDTGIEAKSSSDANGNYNFFNVRVGHYTITVELVGRP